jgi:hypothetical protein
MFLHLILISTCVLAAKVEVGEKKIVEGGPSTPPRRTLPALAKVEVGEKKIVEGGPSTPPLNKCPAVSPQSCRNRTTVPSW